MSVTRVPLQPIEKGALSKLWLGIGIALIIAIAVALVSINSLPAKYGFLAANAKADGVITTESGVQYKILVEGEGESPTDSDVTMINYTGSIAGEEDSIFDQGERAPLPVSGAVPGFSEGLKNMKRGGKYMLWIPPELGYGANDIEDGGEVVIPGGSVLQFEVELLEFIPEAQLRAVQQQMQQQQQMQMEQGELPPIMPPSGEGQ